jgi:uncharacterized protein DUF6799
MKKIFLCVITNLIAIVALPQVKYPNTEGAQLKIINKTWYASYRDSTVHPLDSTEVYSHVRAGFIMLGGQLKSVRNGDVYPQNSPVTLKNGAIVMTDGIIQMANGSTPLLKNEDYIDMDGNIRPLQGRWGTLSMNTN